ncbi:hypothetical protein DF044_21955 [Burkholderia contaminans]|nr:hypothetical protein DF044_21955 [Burkholderia contaminans]
MIGKGLPGVRGKCAWPDAAIRVLSAYPSSAVASPHLFQKVWRGQYLHGVRARGNRGNAWHSRG